jgi:hypothetical protein
MARRFTSGAETEAIQSDGWSVITGTVSINTSSQLSGRACFSAACTSQNRIIWNFNGAVSTAYFERVLINPTALPVGNPTKLAMFVISGGDGGGIWLETSGALTLKLNGGSALATSSAISTGTWTMIELQLNYPASGAATISMRVNGVLIGSGTGSANLPISVHAGGNCNGSAFPTSGGPILFDDVALNDSTGASQNSWPGFGKVVLLKPVSDNARVGFTNGGLGTTNLWQAVDNLPPVGVALASMTATSQISDVAVNATDTYDANVGAFTDALSAGGGGMGSGDVVSLVVALANGGQGGAVNETLAVRCLSNPVASEGTATTGTTAAGTFPTAWTAVFSAYAYAPSVTLGTEPVVRVRKGTSSATAIFYDLMGLLVEFVQTRTTSDTSTSTDSLTSNVALPRSPTDTSASSDSATTNVVQARTLSDTSASSDSIARTVVEARAVFDTSVCSDSITRSVAEARATSDTSLSTGTITSTVAVARSAVDLSVTGDTLTRLLVLLLDVSDTSLASDVIVEVGRFSRSSVDTSTSSDSAATTLALARSISDTSVTSDTASGSTSSGALSRTTSDTSTSSDVVTRALDLARSVADSSASSDLISRTIVVGRATSDVSLSSDVVARVVDSIRTMSDASTTTDSCARLVLLTRVTADASLSSDLATTNSFVGRMVADTSTASDSTMFSQQYLRSAADVSLSSDSTTGGVPLSRSTTDTSLSSDSVSSSVFRPIRSTAPGLVELGSSRSVRVVTLGSSPRVEVEALKGERVGARGTSPQVGLGIRRR